MSDPLHQLPAAELAGRIRRGAVSPTGAVEAYLERIDDRNDDLNAYVTVAAESARERAAEVEAALDRGAYVGPLAGVPIALKDLFQYKAGLRATNGSRVFADYVPEETAVLVERLEAAGAVVLGRTNTPEFGRKAVTDNDLVGATPTPFDASKTAGGSSGGSAAAVAAGLAAFATGSDAAGSIRIPASACGVVGFKPSAGRVPSVSRPNGFAARTPYIDDGPIARTVEDAALAAAVMSGPHPRDPRALPDDGVDVRAALERPAEDLRVAYSPDMDLAPVDPRVRETVAGTAEALERAGATVERAGPEFERSWEGIHDPYLAQLKGLYAELPERMAAAYGVDLLGEHRELLTDPVIDRIEAGREMGVVEYRHADAVRTEVFDAFQDLFAAYDLLLTPTLTVPPFDLGRDGPETVDGEPVETDHGWLLTWPVNMTGHPAISVPAGRVDGLPVGAQLVGPKFADGTVLAGAAAVERAAPWHDWYADLS